MMSKEFARTVIGILGNIISLVLFLSPVQTFHTIWKRKSVEQYSPVPYMATLANCGLWALYGMPMVHPHSTLVVTINGLGLFIEIVFLSLFFVFSDLKKRLRVMIVVVAVCVCLAVLALLVLILAPTTQLRSTVVGSIAMAANILMYASPLSVMKLVITTRSVEYMPFLLSLFTLLNAICWTSYALIKFDLFLMIPNAMGAFFGVAQLILYAVFYKSTKQIMASKKAQTQVSLTEIRTESK
ncbi:Bidirectional sugar transporter SWEET7 [Striga hermonthica]|uniref:Bidirectional sugar transporter SWEET n=1 Tax=Striga hermonthica TaxID=68872 RepID=A0A9N7P2M9_STRHE|nr:Bidirectional sugar transporter SWEET7 [Striga hermonthica]